MAKQRPNGRQCYSLYQYALDEVTRRVDSLGPTPEKIKEQHGTFTFESDQPYDKMRHEPL
jgi:hypothetical protein